MQARAEGVDGIVSKLMAESNPKVDTVAVSNDLIGKPFLVMADQLRKCMVCGEVFSRQEAFRHSRVICYPKEPERCEPANQ